MLSSCGASASPCPCPPAPVSVVALLTLLATTVQRAPGLVHSGVEAACSSVQQPACAARPGLELTTNTLVRDLNVAVSRFDDRRIEVIANGLPLWNGAQLAVDTTIVSPLTAAGEARSRRDPARPVALLEARRRKEATYPELLASARCRLVVIGVEVGGRWGSEAASFLRLQAGLARGTACASAAQL